jgi:hypothetical protein
MHVCMGCGLTFDTRHRQMAQLACSAGLSFTKPVVS